MNKFEIKKKIVEEQERLKENPEQLEIPEVTAPLSQENKYKILKYLGCRRINDE